MTETYTRSKKKKRSKNIDKSDFDHLTAEKWKPGRTEFIASILIVMFIFLVLGSSLIMAGSEDALGNLDLREIGMFILLASMLLVIFEILLVIWIYEDSLKRGMPSPATWIVIVVILPLIGIFIYFVLRPQGEMKKCGHCSKEKLEILVECPHCKHRTDNARQSWRNKRKKSC